MGALRGRRREGRKQKVAGTRGAVRKNSRKEREDWGED